MKLRSSEFDINTAPAADLIWIAAFDQIPPALQNMVCDDVLREWLTTGVKAAHAELLASRVRLLIEDIQAGKTEHAGKRYKLLEWLDAEGNRRFKVMEDTN
jgi:hypothetical protein